MPAPRNLEDVVAIIGICADEAAAARLHETATLLSIAQLDLKARLSGLTEAELAAAADMSGRANGPRRAANPRSEHR